jgi:hypothetical protein
MKYIGQNPVKAGLVHDAEEWKASGAYYIRHGFSGMVDYTVLLCEVCAKNCMKKLN